jgi:predicted regulator of Ras-like GTPase activity (Roadblock/LC7/MglB family)
MNEKLNSIRKFALGVCFAGMVASIVPHSTDSTLMVVEQKRQITKKMNHLGADETMIRGEDGKRVIYAIKKGKLIAITKEIPKINYDKKGMPVSEKTGKPNAIFAVIFGLAAIGLAGVPHTHSLADKLSESMSLASVRRKERKEAAKEKAMEKAKEKATREKESDKGSWL